LGPPPERQAACDVLGLSPRSRALVASLVASIYSSLDGTEPVANTRLDAGRRSLPGCQVRVTIRICGGPWLLVQGGGSHKGIGVPSRAGCRPKRRSQLTR
jgi:hypothetical protein